jgi:predicted metalloprotease with PDZ domain
VRADQLTVRLEYYRAGDHVSLLVARRDKLIRLDLTFGTEPARFQLEIRKDVTSAAKRHLDDWLGKAE